MLENAFFKKKQKFSKNVGVKRGRRKFLPGKSKLVLLKIGKFFRMKSKIYVTVSTTPQTSKQIGAAVRLPLSVVLRSGLVFYFSMSS